MSETHTELRNRLHRQEEPSPVLSTEELLIEKLDIFLSSIELRLDLFEQYFKINDIDQKLLRNAAENGSRSRSSSSASLLLLRLFSASNINMVHQRLCLIKDLVLKSSYTNLDYLYKTLDDQYNYLFNLATPPDPSDGFHEDTKEVLSRKIITTIQYFDEKLVQIDTLIKSHSPLASLPLPEQSKYDHFRFYNFNKALKTAQDRHLHYYELPLNWRENRFIIHGYRFSLEHKDMLKSIFHFNHNETMNIWTHMVGFFIMAYIALVHFPSTDTFHKNSFTDNLVMYVFLVAGLKCLASSVVWHTYSCFANYPVRARCACVDYTGITVLITASVISTEYCLLYHMPRLLATYITFSSLCGFTGFAFNWSPYFDRPECRSLRIGFFVGLALLGATTFFTMCVYDGCWRTIRFFFPIVYKSFVWYWIGVVFYGGLIPERWRYDVVINDDSTCNHGHSPSAVFSGNVENSGRDELEEIEKEIEDLSFEDQEASKNESQDDMYPQILSKHFPAQPDTTRYHRDFFSLWWVDYYFSSHSIWHICVVLGVLGHYSTVLAMFEQIERI